MTIGRREFLAGASALAVSARSALASPLGARGFPGSPTLGEGGSRAIAERPGAIFPPSVRADFPSASTETYLNSGAMHPIGTFAARGMERTLNFRLLGPGPGRADFTARQQQDVKKRYGQLINATEDEIAYTSSTSDGENIVMMGLDLAKKGGNIVIDELQFTSSLYLYKELQKKGVEIRIVKHRNWAIDVSDMDKAIDRNTRLVSMALVSNVNGFMHDAKAVSTLAHARGAYVFADIIQAVGAVPVDVKAMGIDFASAGTYKWLMGERGLGFLYVRKDLQDTVVPTTRYGHRQIYNFNRAELTWEPLPGAAKYETGGIAVLLAACVSEGIDYVNTLTIPKIRAHAKQLTDRLRTEIPPLGYKLLTPMATETPFAAFELKDTAATQKALHDGKINATIIANENRLRLSVSVFNTHDDIDRVIHVLGGGKASL